jgi:peptide/nickel transport system substrate-binding protein
VKHTQLLFIVILILLISGACSLQPAIPTPLPPEDSISTSVPPSPTPIPPTPTQEPDPRLLSVCVGPEPSSLFIYGDNSRTATSIREAVFDNPYAVSNFEQTPRSLDQIPDIQNNSAWYEPVRLVPGDLLIDSDGNYSTLSDGVTYFPSGCSSEECIQNYQGSEEVEVDRLAVSFTLLKGLTWSDGAPVTAEDSVFSYHVAESMYPAVRAGLIDKTDSYIATDPATVEWRGIPGYRDTRYYTNFFLPLPKHMLGSLSLDEVASSEYAARKPLGWGPYMITEWVKGDHISLAKNPHYYRRSDGLPHFDILVFRFMNSSEEALDALLTGECDMADLSTNIPYNTARLLESVSGGYLNAHIIPGTAVELAVFSILPANPLSPRMFNPVEVRQAVALCIDREAIINELSSPNYPVPYSYLLPDHPFFNPELEEYNRDVEKAGELLTGAGWVDHDGNPDTPRVSRGAAGFFYDTPLTFSFLTTSDPGRQRAAEIVKESLMECGIGVDIETLDIRELYSPGPEGLVFGRNFGMAQVGWRTSVEPACMLFHSSEIPGYYPEYAKGWGGANASGFSNPEFDAACTSAQNAPYGSQDSFDEHLLAQTIFFEQLPAIPLYYHTEVVVTRPDLCGLKLDTSITSALWNIEEFNIGDDCP